MASTDKVSLRAVRQSEFLTSGIAQHEGILGLDVTKSAGDGLTVEFDGFTFDGTTTGPKVGDDVYIGGFTGDDAGWNGIYTVTSVAAGKFSAHLPAGKAHLDNVTSSTDTVSYHTLIPLRFTSESLAGQLNKAESDEITGARGVRELIVQGVTAGGNIDGEFSMPSWPALIRSGMMSDWTYSGTNGVAADGSETVTFASASRMTKATAWGLSVGDWIRVAGSTNNDGAYLVTAVNDSATPKTLDVGYGTLSTAQATDDCVVYEMDFLQEGTKLFPYTIERAYADITGGDAHFPRFIGMLIDSFSLSAPAQGRVSISTTWAGSREYGTALNETGTPTGAMGSPSPAPTGSVYEGARNVSFWFDGSSGGCVSQFDMQIGNNLDPRLCVGTLGARSMEPRRFSATGSFTQYYATKDRYDKFMDSTSERLVVKMQGADGALVFDFPRVKYSDATRVASGPNQSLFLNTSWTAIEHADGYTCRVYHGTL